MQVGTALFLAFVVVGLVVLYARTRDRWNWRRGFKRLAFLVALGVASIGLIAFGWEPTEKWWSRSHAAPYTALDEIQIGMTRTDLRVMVGEFSSMLSDVEKADGVEPQEFFYPRPSQNGVLFGTFDSDGRVATVSFAAKGERRGWPPRLGDIAPGDRLDEVEAWWGPSAYNADHSRDGEPLQRIIAWPDRNAWVAIEAGEVATLGIYANPSDAMLPVRIALKIEKSQSGDGPIPD